MCNCDHVVPVIKLCEIRSLPDGKEIIGDKIELCGSWSLNGDSVVCNCCGEVWGNMDYAVKVSFGDGVDCVFDDEHKVWKVNFGVRSLFGSCDLEELDDIKELFKDLEKPFVFDDIINGGKITIPSKYNFFVY